MNHLRTTVALLACSLLVRSFAYAEDVTVSVPPPAGKPGDVPPPATPLMQAMGARRDIASGIMSGAETPDAAITRLHALQSPSGFAIERDGDFALAAIDIGHRLLSAGKPAEAEIFYREGEKSLTDVLTRGSVQSPEEKARYLALRARVRAKYLNQSADARDDLDAALALQPDDKDLKQLRVLLSSGQAEFFKQPAKK